MRRTDSCCRQAPLRSCRRRGAAIDVIVQRSRENRSQLVFTTADWATPQTVTVMAIRNQVSESGAEGRSHR